MAQTFKETAHFNTDKSKFDAGYERIFGKKEKTTTRRERYYSFKLSTGEIKAMTISEALLTRDRCALKRIEEIIENQKVKRTIKDNFEPGWQENICEYVGTRSQYNTRLKELGLVEVGNDFIPKDTTTTCNPYNDTETILEAGVSPDSVLGNAMKSGELLKDVK